MKQTNIKPEWMRHKLNADKKNFVPAKRPRRTMPPPPPPPLKEEEEEEREHIVAGIESHANLRTRKDNTVLLLHFKVIWEQDGWPSTWEPVHNLYHITLLHEYMEKHRLWTSLEVLRAVQQAYTLDMPPAKDFMTCMVRGYTEQQVANTLVGGLLLL